MVSHHGDHNRPPEFPKKLTDYLQWMMIWSKAADIKEIGRGEHPAQNPPPIDGHSAAVLIWYSENVTTFVKECGLMPELIRELKLSGEEKVLTLAKLNVIYEAQMKISRTAAAEADNA